MSFLTTATDLVRRVRVSSDLSKITLNTTWLVADKATRMIMSLVVGVWIARYLGPDNFGIWSYSGAFILIFFSLSTLGIDGLIVRDLAADPGSEHKILGSGLLLRLLTAVATYGLAFIGILILKGSEGIFLPLIAIMAISFFIQSFDVIDFYFQAKLLSKYTIMARLAALVIANGLRVGAILMTLSLFAFGWIQIAELLMAAFFLIFAYSRTGGAIRMWRVDMNYARKLFLSCYGLLIDSMLVVVTMQVDRIILESFYGESVVGMYSVAVNLAQLWYFIPVFLGASVLPFLVRKRQESEDAYNKALRTVWTVLFYISIAIGAVFSLGSEYIVDFLYGEKFLEAAPILGVYIWCCIFVFHVSIRSRSMIIESMEKYIGIFSLMMGLLYVFLNFMLIPHLNAMGAALSSLISWAASVLIFPLFFKKTRKYPLLFLKSFKI